MAGKLSGKVALVTGASKGIGAAIAVHLANEGAAVVVNYASDQRGAERVVGEIVGNGGRAVAVQADVSREADVQRLFAEADATFGRRLDVLVNNAGVYEFKALDEVTPEHFHRMFNLNVLGLLLASREAARRFGADGGSIINVGSVAARSAPPMTAAYSGTKGAVDSITRSLSQELGPRRIRVNSLNPGMVDTEGARTLGVLESDFRKQIEAQTPLGRVGVPADIATVAVFLAGDDSKWITGESLFVAGGLR